MYLRTEAATHPMHLLRLHAREQLFGNRRTLQQLTLAWPLLGNRGQSVTVLNGPRLAGALLARVRLTFITSLYTIIYGSSFELLLF